MTNRHVIEALIQSQEDTGFPDEQRLLLFVYPRNEDGWQTGHCRIQRLGVIANGKFDVGFCEYNARPESEFAQVSAVATPSEPSIALGEAIAVCGYPYGEAMLHENGRVYRWGPVVQFGYVSAIAPFDGVQRPKEVLLDVRIAGGMSGSPVFRPGDGKVIAIAHSAWDATTAFALPLDKPTIESWLEVHNKAFPNSDRPAAWRVRRH